MVPKFSYAWWWLEVYLHLSQVGYKLVFIISGLFSFIYKGVFYCYFYINRTRLITRRILQCDLFFYKSFSSFSLGIERIGQKDKVLSPFSLWWVCEEYGTLWGGCRDVSWCCKVVAGLMILVSQTILVSQIILVSRCLWDYRTLFSRLFMGS